MENTKERIRNTGNTVKSPNKHNGFEVSKMNEKHQFADSKISNKTQARKIKRNPHLKIPE